MFTWKILDVCFVDFMKKPKLGVFYGWFIIFLMLLSYSVFSFFKCFIDPFGGDIIYYDARQKWRAKILAVNWKPMLKKIIAFNLLVDILPYILLQLVHLEDIFCFDFSKYVHIVLNQRWLQIKNNNNNTAL